MVTSNELSQLRTLPLHDFPVEAGEAGLPGAGDVAWRLWLNIHEDGHEDVEYAGYFARFLDEVDTTKVRELVFGNWGEPYEESSEELIRLLTEAAGRFPELRLIAVGDMPFDECEISWIEQSDITPLLESFPDLEVLEVRGSSELWLNPVRHESLRVLRLETGGLPQQVTRAVAACDLPRLERLDLWLGTENYGGDTTVADLAPILGGERLPALRRLGLEDSEIQDEVVAAVAAAPVVARLESLSLAMGTLTDAGAEALLSGQPLTHLKELDLHHHFLGEPMMERLRAALPGVEVNLDRRQVARDDWFYVAVSE